MNQCVKGSQSIAYLEAPYIVGSACVAGKKEGEGPLGDKIDIIEPENLFGEKTWEMAEGAMQKAACGLALKKTNLKTQQIRYMFGGDLLRQGIATSMGAESMQIPMFGLFGACSTSGEALALASMNVAAGYGSICLLLHPVILERQKKNFVFR